MRWAASVYGRHKLELRPIAERILREELGDEVVMRFWTDRGGEPPLKMGKVELKDFDSRAEGRVTWTGEEWRGRQQRRQRRRAYG